MNFGGVTKEKKTLLDAITSRDDMLQEYKEISAQYSDLLKIERNKNKYLLQVLMSIKLDVERSEDIDNTLKHIIDKIEEAIKLGGV